MAEKIDESPQILVEAHLRALFTLVAAYSLANYQPSNWHTIMLPAIEKNDALLMLNRYTWNWMKFFTDLIVLGYEDLTYVRKLLTADYLDKYFVGSPSDLSHLQLLNLFQAVQCRSHNRLDTFDCARHIDQAIKLQLKRAECPLSEFLAIELGSHLVLSRIVTRYGHFIQHLLVRRRDSGELVDVDKFKALASMTSGLIALDDIECAEEEQL